MEYTAARAAETVLRALLMDINKLALPLRAFKRSNPKKSECPDSGHMS